MKKSQRKKLIKRLDKVFSMYIRWRDGYKCCIPQCRSKAHENMTCGHLITRAKYSTRWDERNAFAQCRGHNFRHEFEPELMTRWYIRKFGLDAYEQLIQDSNKLFKPTDLDLQLMIDKYSRPLLDEGIII